MRQFGFGLVIRCSVCALGRRMKVLEVEGYTNEKTLSSRRHTRILLVPD